MTTKFYETTACDGPDCDQVVHNTKDSQGDGTFFWYKVEYFTRGSRDTRNWEDIVDLDFCSIKCLEDWCKQQRTK